MADDSQINVAVTATTDDAENALARVADALGNLSSVGGATSTALSAMIPAALANQVVELGEKIYEAAKGIVEWADHIYEAGAQIEHFSEELGVSTETMSTFGYMATLLGLGTESMAMGLTRLERNMSEAANGTGRAASAFLALGINVHDSNGNLKSMDEMMPQIADAFARLKDGPEKDAIAIDLMGRAGARLIPFLNQGSAGMERYKEAAEASGLVLNEITTKGMEETAIKASELAMAAEGLATTIANRLRPVVDALTGSLTYLINKLNQAFRTESDFTKDEVAKQIEQLKIQKKSLEDAISSNPQSGNLEFYKHQLEGVEKELEAATKQQEALNKADAEKADKPSPIDPRKVQEDVKKIESSLDELYLKDNVQTENRAKYAADYWQTIAEEADTAFNKVQAGGTLTTEREMAMYEIRDTANKNYYAALLKLRDQNVANARQMNQEEVNAAIQKATVEYQINKDEWDKQVIAKTMTKEQEIKLEKKALEDLRDLKIQELELESATTKDTEAGRLALANKIATVRLETSKQEADLDKAAVEAKKAADDQYYKEYKAGLDELRAADKADLDAGVLSTKEYYDKLIALANDWIRITGQMYPQDVVKMRQAETEKTNIVKQQTDQQRKIFDSYANSVGSAFKSMLTGVLQGTQTWQQAMKNLVANLAMAWIENSAQIALKWVEDRVWEAIQTMIQNAVMTEANQAYHTEAMAMDEEDAIASDAVKVQQITGNAAVASSGVWASLSAIPFVGPFIAPAIAASVLAAVLALASSFDVGAWEIPNDQLAMIHKGETIVPASMAQSIRSGQAVLSAGGAGGGGGGGGTTVNFTIQALDGRSVQQLLHQQGSTIANVFAKQIRQANSDLSGLRYSTPGA